MHQDLSKSCFLCGTGRSLCGLHYLVGHSMASASAKLHGTENSTYGTCSTVGSFICNPSGSAIALFCTCNVANVEARFGRLAAAPANRTTPFSISRFSRRSKPAEFERLRTSASPERFPGGYEYTRLPIQCQTIIGSSLSVVLTQGTEHISFIMDLCTCTRFLPFCCFTCFGECSVI